MSQPLSPPTGSMLPSRGSDGVQLVCQRFEAAWQSTSASAAKPRIEEFLQLAPVQERALAFRLLLEIELKYRTYNLPDLIESEYLARFPDQSDQVQKIFQEKSWHRRPTVPNDEENVSSPKDVKSPLETVGHPSALLSRANKNNAFPNIPGYEIQGKLGEGGMGIVYKALHLKLRRIVALKMLTPDRALSSQRLERFLKEARSVAQFQHPNVVQIFEIGEVKGKPYFSLEFVTGGTLEEKLAGQPQDPSKSAAFVETLARTLEYAHRNQVIHRDLKPSNILITTDGNAKIADFGLAKQLESDDPALTEEAGIIGTPSYMSPEQAWGNNSEVGPPADIYALGVILYEMLAGRPPFRAVDKWHTLQLVRNQEPLSPRTLVPQIPRDLELICLRCLNKNKHDRFATAGDLADELGRFRRHEPILTRPAPKWEQAWKWMKRNPLLTSLIGVSALAVLSLILLLDQRTRAAQRESVEQRRINDLRVSLQEQQLKAQEAMSQGKLQDAQGTVRAILEMIRNEPALTGFQPSLLTLQGELTQREAKQKGRSDAEAGLKRLLRARDEALFRGSVFAGVDLPASVAATRKACEEGLAELHWNFESAKGPAWSQYLTPDERHDSQVMGYELLLVLAEAQSQPEPGQPLADPERLRESLKTLDRVTSLDVPLSAAYHLRRANYLEKLGDQPAALAARKLASASPPRNALDFFLLGDALQKQGKLNEATHEFTQALREQPDHFWARYFLAMCHLQLQRPSQARDHLTACLASRGNFSWLYLLRGFALGQLGDFTLAHADYEKALAFQPDTQAVFGIRINQAVLHLGQAKLLDVPTQASPFWGYNLASAIQGSAGIIRLTHLKQASARLEEAQRINPENYLPFRYRALIAVQSHRRDEAMDLLTKGLQHVPQQDHAAQAQLLGQRARLHLQAQDFDSALADFTAAIALAPSAEDLADRGKILQSKQRTGDALADCRSAIKLRPQEPELYRWLAELVSQQRKDSDAVEALDQYLAKGGRPSAEIFRNRGVLRARLKQYSSAIADFTQALELQPDAGTRASRGWVLLANEALPLALRDFEEALKLDPTHAESYAGSGLTRVRLGQNTQAMLDADTALRLAQPATPRLLWNVAHIYAQLGGQASLVSTDASAKRLRFQEDAVLLLRRALEKLPANERGLFWRQFIAGDALLNPLRETLAYQRLEKEFGNLGGAGD